MSTISFEPITLTYTQKGELTETEYVGTFKVKPKLSPIEVLDCDRDRRELLGSPKNDEQVGGDATNLAICLSQLKARVTDAPSWYKDSFGLRLDFHDTNVIYDLFKEVVAIETKWKADLKKAAEEAKAKLLKPNA
jgi:hypothetical protein